jgi:NAD(P)-dependent dehydrogenase (short-subunit alcohol dehydrogenase family)
MGRVQGQVAVVTGAAKGIGRAIAQRLAEEGALVALGDIDAAELKRTADSIAAAGGEVITAVGDVTDEGPAAALIAAAVERFGRLDILVNNVGGNRTAKIWDLKVEDWDFVLRLNLRSTFPLHPRRRAAHDAAEERAHRLHLLGRPRGHAVDRVLPGRLRVLRGQGGHPRLRPRRGARAGRARHQRERRRAGPHRHRADGAQSEEAERHGGVQPQSHDAARPTRAAVEIANAVLFLASPEASYITGHTLPVTGGR